MCGCLFVCRGLVGVLVFFLHLFVCGELMYVYVHAWYTKVFCYMCKNTFGEKT